MPGPIPIDQFKPAASPADAISKALSLAKDYYGIKQAGMAQDLLNQHLQKGKQELDVQNQLNDPDSPLSQLARTQAIQGIQMQAKINHLKPEDVTALLSAIQGGRQAVASDEGPSFKDVPAMSGAQLAANPETKSMMDLTKGQQEANIAQKRIDAANIMANNRMENMNSNAAQRTVNNDRILNTYIPRIDGAQKILNLIDAGERGEFATNKALLGQLNAEIARLETGAQSPGLNASEKTEMNSSAATLHDLVDTITGGVTGVDLSNKFAQARGMVKDLGKSYYNQIGDRLNNLKSGSQDGQEPIYESKLASLQNSYKQFGPESDSNPISVGSNGSSRSLNPIAAESGDMISVVSPEGKSGKIPKSSLQKALQRGFKVSR